ncbi:MULTISPECIES: bestrophin family ion channel [unclassified Aeromicrobium]|jgi:putative membrane protein|uniref:bestrophin family protein n=1 Tax=unclassified Aeromicrobium TaxID=2633570 RepID=UPI000AA5EB12|nr:MULTISPECIES: bestrophin family ion channel [unclassified Aeromicrobium]
MITSRLPRSASVWRPLLVPTIMLLTWDVGVTVAFQLNWFEFPGITIQYTLYGTAIALFLGFMVNAGYARWWEARTLWGSIVNHSRNVAREATTLLDPTVPNARRELGPDMVRAQIAYVHSLRTSLRQQDPPPEIDRYLSRDAAVRVKNASSGPTATLTHLGRLLAEARRRGMIDDFARVQVESTLSVLTDAQGGLERIKKTPLPVQYRLLPSFFARTFCIILPFAVYQDLQWWTPIGSGLVGMMFLLAVQVGKDLADPFSDDVHDVPMTAISRTIEIDLLEMIGADAPGPVNPVGQVLW